MSPSGARSIRSGASCAGSAARRPSRIFDRGQPVRGRCDDTKSACPGRPAMRRGCWAKAMLPAIMLACAVAHGAAAQDLLRFLDLKSDDFTKADMTRGEIEAALADAGPAGLVDLSGKRLNGLDLS